MRGTDPLGNRIAYGCQHEEHDTLAYVSTGIMDMGEYRVAPDAIPVMAYREPTPLTYLTEDELESVGALPQDATGICHLVYQKLHYVPGMTTTETTASEVLAAGQGVCQDYAHLMIALCRASGMAARYVCGMMEGEGETHAWVEVFDGKAWTGYDPTHDVAIKYGYLKLGHGRDAADCPVSRGIYMGNASRGNGSARDVEGNLILRHHEKKNNQLRNKQRKNDQDSIINGTACQRTLPDPQERHQPW